MEINNSVHSQPLIKHTNGGEYRQIKLWIIFKLFTLGFFCNAFLLSPLQENSKSSNSIANATLDSSGAIH